MIIEDRMTFDDGPSPGPVAPAPIVVVPASPSFLARLRPYLPWATVALLAAALGLQIYKGRTPGPSPTPQPQPVAIDPQVRECSANYFGGYPRWYGDVSPLIAAASPDYNEVTSGILKKREMLGTKLGLRIDELTKPLYDPATLTFKDRAESQRVYQNIEASMIAGLKDAAASFK